MASMRISVAVLTLALAAPWLGGCSDTAGGLSASAVDAQRPHIAARPGVRASSVTIAFKSLDGAPPEVVGRFVAAMSSALAARDIVTAESATATFILQGHLNAWPAENGVAVAWVWDVYDQRHVRRQRMDDQIVVRAAGGNPWAAVDERALASIAGVTAENLAGFLTNSPEAIAASAGAAVASAIVPGTPAVSSRALSFAPLD